MKINNKTMQGVRIGENFLSALRMPPPLKGFLENKSPVAHGKEVLNSGAYIDEREITLVFEIAGQTSTEYETNLSALETELLKGFVDLEIDGKVYHLIYLRSNSFGQNRKRTISRLSVKFNEPNPSVRT